VSALWVFLGGGVGAVLRWSLSAWIGRRVDGPFPWGTLTVNVLGCLAIGFLVGWLADRHELGTAPRLLLVTGLLGGFTTFSTFGLETWRLLQSDGAPLALGYVGASLIAGTLGVAGGLEAARSLS